MTCDVSREKVKKVRQTVLIRRTLGAGIGTGEEADREREKEHLTKD